MRRRQLFCALSLGLMAACAYAGIDGDAPTNASKGPRRGLPSTTDDGGSSEVKDAGSDQASAPPPVVDAKPPSTTCTPTGLALCFRFEGAAVDQSTAPVTPRESTGIVYTVGKEDLAALFGTMSALRFAPNPVFDLPREGATIEAWINREATGADAVVFDDDERFSLTINAAGNVWCKSSGGAVTGARVVLPNQWAHVACVIDNGTMTAYVNGAPDNSGPGTVVPSGNPNAAAAIGGNSPDGEPFVGLIDSFRLWRIARTPAELAAAAAQ